VEEEAVVTGFAPACRSARRCLHVRFGVDWPTQGARHEAAKGLAGGLLRPEWSVDAVEEFVEAVALAANDEEIRGRVRNIATE
jgi:hypothetical protein